MIFIVGNYHNKYSYKNMFKNNNITSITMVIDGQSRYLDLVNVRLFSINTKVGLTNSRGGKYNKAGYQQQCGLKQEKMNMKSYVKDIDFNSQIFEIYGYIFFWSKKYVFSFYVVPTEAVDHTVDDDDLYEQMYEMRQIYALSEFERITNALS